MLSVVILIFFGLFLLLDRVSLCSHLDSNSQSSCLNLLSAGITDVGLPCPPLTFFILFQQVALYFAFALDLQTTAGPKQTHGWIQTRAGLSQFEATTQFEA